MNVIQDIPKLYTALAEWLSCLVFVVLLKKRYPKSVTVLITAAALMLLCGTQYLIGVMPVTLWIPGMVVALFIMYGVIFFCCQIPAADAGFYWAVAFIFAEFQASLEWQIYSFFAAGGEYGFLTQTFFLLIFYSGAFIFLYFLEKRRLDARQNLKVSFKEMCSAALVAISAFLISNISYVYDNTPLSGRMSAEIFYIRTLVDFAGVIMLIALQDRWKELQMKQELDSIQAILQRQYEQYRQSSENIEMINRKYHDLKHQIGIIRMEPDAEKREEYLRQMESGITNYEVENKTGNEVLDTILTGKQIYCMQHHINMTVVADGAKLNFMDVMDVCSIFGNALDNAIESVEKLAETEKRLIRVAVYLQNNFLMIRVENYFETPLDMDEGVYKTTKKNKDFHGYGIKSIRYTAEKYGGSVAIRTEENWFCLRVLIPFDEQM